MAIEAGAREMGISSMEMRRRLEKMNLIKRLLLDNYEVMHTQSLKHVGEDVAEALKTGKHRRAEKYENNTLSWFHPFYRASFSQSGTCRFRFR